MQSSKLTRLLNRVKSQIGFTLLEVVVAMAIVGLGVVTLLEVFSLGLRLGARSSEKTETVAYGRQTMDEVLIRRELREVREEGPVGERHHWTLEVVPFGEESELLRPTGWELKEVTLQMGSRSRRGPQVRMKTLRLVKKEGQ